MVSAYTTNTSVSLASNPQSASNSQIGRVTFTGVDTVLTGSGNDTVFENVSFPLNVNTGAGNDVIQSGSGNDTLNAGASLSNLNAFDRIMTGAGNDTVVVDANFGRLIVLDFNTGDATNHDTINVSALGFASVQDVLDHISNVSSNVMRLTVDATQYITFYNVQKAAFEANPATIQI